MRAFFVCGQKKPRDNPGFHVRSTGLEPVPIAGHAPQTCAYADSATTACVNSDIDYSGQEAVCQDWYGKIFFYICTAKCVVRMVDNAIKASYDENKEG